MSGIQGGSGDPVGGRGIQGGSGLGDPGGGVGGSKGVGGSRGVTPYPNPKSPSTAAVITGLVVRLL